MMRKPFTHHCQLNRSDVKKAIDSFGGTRRSFVALIAFASRAQPEKSVFGVINSVRSTIKGNHAMYTPKTEKAFH